MARDCFGFCGGYLIICQVDKNCWEGLGRFRSGFTEEGFNLNKSAIKLSEIKKNFGQTEIIKGVNLDIFDGERHAIIGPNGAGKSTLFNLISGRFAPTTGKIELHGEDITNLEPQIINRKGLARFSNHQYIS